MKSYISKAILFLLSFLLGQKIIVVMFPFGEFEGQSFGKWLDWFFSLPSFLIGTAFGFFALVISGYWIMKLRFNFLVVLGIGSGAYFSYLFYPMDGRTSLETTLFDESTSDVFVLLFYFIITVVIPIVASHFVFLLHGKSSAEPSVME